MVLKIIPRQVALSSARRFYSAKAQPKQAPSEARLLPKGKPKVSTLPNGLLVASLENHSPLTSVCVAVKAGSRYENDTNLGITHVLRACAGLTTKNEAAFSIIRHLQLAGATLSASCNREHLIYSAQCMREQTDTTLYFLSEVTSQQVFKPWEIQDFLLMPSDDIILRDVNTVGRLKLELALVDEKPEVLVMEALHKVAFRTGLGNSLYCPKRRVGTHDTQMLNQYVRDNFTTSRTAVIGVGISHDELTEFATKLKLDTGAVGANVAKYGGGESRVETNLPLAHVAVATEGVSLKDPKEAAAAGILQAVMGNVPNVKRGNPTSKLMQAGAKATDKPFAVSCINANYSDSGLFGFYLIGQPEDMGKLTKAVVDQYYAVAKAGVSDADLLKAKHIVKATAHMSTESNSGLLEEIQLQVMTAGKIMDTAEVDTLIDSVKAADVNAIAKKIIAGKPSMACIGNIAHTPYLDQLR